MSELSLLDLDGQSVELLPAREALGYYSTRYTKKVALVAASNSSTAISIGGFLNTTASYAEQNISVSQ